MSGDKEISTLFTPNTTEYSRFIYFTRQLKLYVFYFMRTELVVKLVFEVKSALDFLLPYIYEKSEEERAANEVGSRNRDVDGCL